MTSGHKSGCPSRAVIPHFIDNFFIPQRKFSCRVVKKTQFYFIDRDRRQCAKMMKFMKLWTMSLYEKHGLLTIEESDPWLSGGGTADNTRLRENSNCRAYFDLEFE